MLGRAGYDTAAIGKMHFNSPHTYGFALRRDLEDYHAELARRGKKPIPAGIRVQPRWRPFRDPARIWLNAAELPYPAVDADMDGTYFAEQAAQFLRSRASDPSSCLSASTSRTRLFIFRWKIAAASRPPVFPFRPFCRRTIPQIPAIFRDLTPSEKQGIAAAYYTSVEFLDRKVGQVLKALDESGQAENTLVLYTADHGYLWASTAVSKNTAAMNRPSARPFSCGVPKAFAPSQATSALVEFVDVFPTVVELCGLKVPANVQGRSLLPLLTGHTKTHRSEIFIEYAPNDEAADPG